MKKLILVAVLFAFILAPASLLAMDHSKMDGKKMDHGTMDHGSKDQMDKNEMDHGAMGHDAMDMLGTEVKEGVKASAMIKDTSAAMAKMGMEHTHHLMVGFENAKSNAVIDKGTVAVKVINPDETEAKPVKMMGMSGSFGADLVLKQKGMYHFYIGTKLEDGTKRKYHFHTEVK